MTSSVINANQGANRYSAILLVLTVLVTIVGGLLAFSLPSSLLPSIDRPLIQISTYWPGKVAEEMEERLVTPLETALGGMENLVSIQSQSRSGSATITLEYKPRTDMEKMYVEVMSRVNDVPDWPSDVQRPIIRNLADGSSRSLSSAMLYSEKPVSEQAFIDAYKNIVEPTLMKVNGLSSLSTSYYNNVRQRVDIEFDPQLLENNALSIEQVTRALSGIVDSSGDVLDIGSREFALHFSGRMDKAQLMNLPIHRSENHIVRLGDIATINKRVAMDWGNIYANGHRAFFSILAPTKDANILETLEQVNIVLDELNAGPLKSLDMRIVLMRDDSKSIKTAISQLYFSLLLGIVLASVVLYYCLRKYPVVLLIFMTIPICLSLVIIAMKFGGYSLNLISISGVALSVGLLLDASIVVIENILRLKSKGEPTLLAIKKGTSEVKNAVFSSTISSIVIFIPIMLINTGESQLFEDLAFTISSALLASLVASLVVLPVLARYFIEKIDADSILNQKSNGLFSFLSRPVKSKSMRLVILGLGIPGALLACYLMMPSIDLLPTPKKKGMQTYISFTDSLSAQAVREKIIEPILARIDKEVEAGTAPEYESTSMFCLVTCGLYFIPKDGWDYPSFKEWVETKITHDLPGTRVFTRQASLLYSVLPNSRNSYLDIQGEDLFELQKMGLSALNGLKEAFPGAMIRADTPLTNESARITFTPKYEQLLYYGLTNNDLRRYLVSHTQGLFVGRFYLEDDTYPFYLKAETPLGINELLNKQVYVTNHGLIPMRELVEADYKLSTGSLRRINRQPTVTLLLSPPEDMAVGEFVDAVQSQLTQMSAQAEYAQGSFQLRGGADSLGAFIYSFLEMFVFSVLILVVLLWFSLGRWRYTLAVLMSMPLAFAGGMIALMALKMMVSQNMDIITMIGFIILMGLVINNAILIVNKFDNAQLSGKSQQDAIAEALNSRRRPIYMSTGTSIFGMLPVMLAPGEGAEMYRGLAAVIVGGMTFSALFTLSFMSALLSLPVFKHQPGEPSKSAQGENEEYLNVA